MLEWYQKPEWVAERVCSTLKHRDRPIKNFKNHGAEMQEIYFTVYKRMGIRLKPDILYDYWRIHFEDEFNFKCLIERRRQLQRTIELTEKKLEKINAELKAHPRYNLS